MNKVALHLTLRMPVLVAALVMLQWYSKTVLLEMESEITRQLQLCQPLSLSSITTVIDSDVTHEDGCNPYTEMPDDDQASETKEDDEITDECSDTYPTVTDKACFPDGRLSSEQKMFIIQHGPCQPNGPFSSERIK